jgi:hypothetical protein
MLPTTENLQQYLLGPIISQWYARFTSAEKSKERFTVMAKLCRQFLGSSAKAMWEDSFRREFYPAIAQPQFMVSLNKAFELVAIIGPSLYWQNPSREVRSTGVPDQSRMAQLMGVTEEDMLKVIQQQQAQQGEALEVRNSLATLVMDSISKQHPGGTKIDNELAIQDALVTGRGCMWTETYSDRATGETMVGSFYDPVDNLLIDPDAKDPAWRDVKWISRTHVEPIWVVERRFGYPPGYLKGKGTHISSEYMAKLEVEVRDGNSMYQDMIEWKEVWSIGGIGARVTGANAQLGQALDKLTGDYCYLALTRNLMHPLNLPPLLISQGSPDQILEALMWRTARFGKVCELWQDRRWPVEKLDFYPVVGSCWPMAVLGPGIGSLLAMNILLVSQLTMSWDRRRDIIAVNGAYADEVESAIKGEGNPAVLKINSASNMSITEIVAFVQRPEVQGNLLEWIQYLDSQFKMATGLDDIHYGISRTQSRVSGDVQSKTAAASVRPEKMATDVHEFVVNCGKKELWLAAMYIEGQQLQYLLGDWGAAAWDTMLGSMPFTQLCREMDITIEATDLRRPNRDKDMADLERLVQFYIPSVTQYSLTTGDEKPFNAFLHKFATAMQMTNPEDLYFGPWHPMPDQTAIQMQQEAQQVDIAKTQADTEEVKAKTVARLVDAQYKQQGATAPAMQKLKWNDIFNQQKLKMQDEAHLQNLVFLQEQQDIKEEAARAAIKTKPKAKK